MAVVGGAVTAGFAFTPGAAADPGTPATPVAVPAAPVPRPAARLVAHEWGTFTSFSGSDGEAVGFAPNNTDLPDFVYPAERFAKGQRLLHGGLVSMETPVVYFYAGREMKVSVNVDFPKGWITEWYPFAHGAPDRATKSEKTGGQSIRWNVTLTPDEPARFPIDKNNRTNPYYAARETDAVPLQVEVAARHTQYEKFLFYRGVGTFPPPVTVRALGGDRLRVVNNSGGRATGLVLVSVRNGKIGFRAVGELESGADLTAALPATDGARADLAAVLVKELTAAGLYEKEAKAMVKTWESAWFGEEGSRLLYLVPRAKTDALLPITIDPKPTELVRVLVGRHDFLTPEQEATAERQVLRLRSALTELNAAQAEKQPVRLRAAQAELNAVQAELQKLGRFTVQAQNMAAKRLNVKPTP
jgi:hypothetical protein